MNDVKFKMMHRKEAMFLFVCFFVAFFIVGCSGNGIIKLPSKISENRSAGKINRDKMRVEIWSDVACPFCYIGKRKFEIALSKFEHKDKVEIVWKSYILDPSIQYEEGKTLYQYLCERKGWSMDYTRQINEHVINMAKEVGLTYHMDEAKVANTFNAHRLSHLAAKHGLQGKAEEKLFAAYFTEGKNISEEATLIQLGVEIGLDSTEVKSMLNSKEYYKEVQSDLEEAQQIGVRGVPFFVANRKMAVSGAQDSEVFLQFLEKMWEEEYKDIKGKDGSVCEDGVCTPSK